jgi:hypothetical protein
MSFAAPAMTTIIATAARRYACIGSSIRSDLDCIPAARPPAFAVEKHRWLSQLCIFFRQGGI